ncbi:PEP-CTERM sorting domain-containing protein [Granulicella sp. dw_53]|uniref:PEP-CTERM sorting domain-containing protein n=1 Tax=Granulicella sp. dw_53 TaxID=2719792 RepID=UPI001BD4E1C6|nr:PEP-CTERM sorting domain-containing protein [Granulicella sp. dw_53]
MRRKIQLLLLLLLIAATTETGVRASTDCERWMAAYKVQLAQTKALKRIQAAHARAKHLAQTKLANYVKKPVAPHPHPAHFVRPRYTRQQILDRFNIACGDLPAVIKPGDRLVEGKVSPAEFLSEMEPYEPVELASTGDGGFIPTGDTPPFTSGSGSGGGSNGGFPGTPIFGGGGGGGGGNTPPDIPVTPVPEPGSIALVLTGIVGAAGVVRRKLQG